jgi:hypothetical protein
MERQKMEVDRTPEEQWRDLIERMLAEISQWQRNHPKATRAGN